MEPKPQQPESGQAPRTFSGAGLDFRIIFNASSNGMAITEVESGIIVEVNATWQEATGISRVDAVGRTALELRLWPDAQKRASCIAELQRLGRLMHFETDLRLKSVNTPHWISAHYLNWEGGRYILWEFCNVAKQKQSEEEIKTLLVRSEDARLSLLFTLETIKSAEDARRASEERFRSLFDGVPDGIYVHDQEGRIVDVNQVACDLIGYTREELLGKLISDVEAEIPLAELKPLWDRIRAGHSATAEGIHRRHDGTTYPVEVHVAAFVTGDQPLFFAAVRDITDRRRNEAERLKLQEQLAQATKMESIGRLAGGVAHDFNNMLQAILGNVDLALTMLPPHDVLRSVLDDIRKSALRSANLTRQLLAFARRQTAAPAVLDLNETVERMLKMLRRLIGENIELNWHPGPDLGSIKMDPSQVDQILANLCLNARDAIKGVGRVSITTEKISPDDTVPGGRPEPGAGNYVRLSVTDNGSGISDEVLPHLFEPFYTTKAVGKGTGLGLATVYGIVSQNGGFIRVKTVVNEGTTFHIYLPRHVEKAAAEPEEPAGAANGGHETILLVEDELSILQITGNMLKNIGYTVLAAATPGEAIELATEYGGEIDLLLTDVVMPGMNGWDLAIHLRAQHPRLKRLFMSAYTAEVLSPDGILEEDVYFLQKPFSLKALADKVRMVIQADGG